MYHAETNTIMATKIKDTKESAPKAAKKAAPAPAPEKKSATKAVIAAAPPQESPLVEKSKPAKTASKAKPAPRADAREISQESTVKPVKKSSPKEKAAVEQPVPQAPPVEPEGQRWQEIKLILEKLKDDTIREIRKSVKIGTEAVAAIEPGGDIYDQASSERDRELGLLLGDREREKIHNIDEALLRIVDGDYGICEECDEDIPLGRLKAMPFTRHCVKCKSDLEKLQAQTKRVEEERAYREIPLGSEEDES